MGIEMSGTRSRLLDHRGESRGLALEDLDLMLRPGAGLDDEVSTLVGIAGLAVALAVALAGGIVLEQLADLGEREAGVVAQAADELEPIEIRGVVQPVVAVRAGG